jgi:hypothetical protein
MIKNDPVKIKGHPNLIIEHLKKILLDKTPPPKPKPKPKPKPAPAPAPTPPPTKKDDLIDNWDTDILNIELEQNYKKIVAGIKSLLTRKKGVLTLPDIMGIFPIATRNKLILNLPVSKFINGLNRIVDYLNDDEKIIKKRELKDWFHKGEGGGYSVNADFKGKLFSVGSNKKLEDAWKNL